MAREVPLSPDRYGIPAGYTFKKWGTRRATAMLDWIAASYGSGIADALVNLIQGFLIGTLDARSASEQLGGILTSAGHAGNYDAFLRMAACDATSGLERNGGPVWSENPAIQSALEAKGLDPDAFYAEDPLMIYRLMLAMLAETFRPFGSAWDFVALLFGAEKRPTSDHRKPSGSPT